ncbi:hypothetical protein E6P09_11380 [Haloferax mediterranei ATCC 33500]|uniref:Uncharacterized protein n=1 Tax=Haloferax mediterranei (strain ATCC 33500 / DSM 1411 / JCM 8866 / NBRC 14739 / NCIMB 2177 / R-4) TaxID=523841 RepID=I3R567_HALMT|nr:hypothetical protein [Haloferax mediterranei]AFK19377.1 hypothetical protein HFX_1671 [Haloferax mediterranei ATCC 33500]AHZ21272.1 hypothetical protein BM92_00755 [Haloferax mediterranei ATCC 33500]EMA04433.1 hypothetical protein C439_02122 [Haloferax mediterranei ATCC 33500]MDX5989480.1 hypothetical protein [Haloferax mediterranei ATCC 33500]QCQ75841.1 hypothetical protein E6P09_11380 [Haloferax mediterranei ATCC 33500]
MSARTRSLLVFVLVLGALGAAGSYGLAYDSHLGQHAVSLALEPAEPGDESTITDVDDLPPAAAEMVRSGVEDGHATIYRDDRDDVTESLESLSGYVRVDGETYRVFQAADENMTLFGPLLTLTALFLSMGVLGIGVAALRTGAFRPLSIAASLSIPGVALAIDVAVTLLDSMVAFSGGVDLPVVPAATGLVVVGVAARKRKWALALSVFLAVMVTAAFADVLGGTSLGPIGTLAPGIPLFVLGYVLGGEQSSDDSAGVDASAASA